MWLYIIDMLSSNLRQVAQQFRKNGHHKEADFCQAVADYIKAHDDRGISGKLVS
jgi:hypothetical protein